MSCRNHRVEINEKNGQLHCPECKHQFTDEQARRLLEEAFGNKKSARRTLKMFKLIGASITSKSEAVRRRLSLRILKLQEKYLKEK